MYTFKNAAFAALSVGMASAATDWIGSYISDSSSCGDKITSATFYQSNQTCPSYDCVKSTDPSSTQVFYGGTVCGQNPTSYFNNILKTSTLPYYVIWSYSSSNCSEAKVMSAFFTQAGGDCRAGQSLTANLLQNGSIQVKNYNDFCNSSSTPFSSSIFAKDQLNRCHEYAGINMSTKQTVIGGPNCKLSDGSPCSTIPGFVAPVSDSKKKLPFSSAALVTSLFASLFFL